MAEKKELQRCEVYYSGRVQGVGFRYTAHALARRFAVGGFVKNLPDGRVQIVVEGAPAEIDAFLSAVRAEMGYHVSDIQELAGQPTGRFNGFEIRF